MLFKLFFVVALFVAFQGAQASIFTPNDSLTPHQQTTRVIARAADIVKRSGQDLNRLIKKVRQQNELQKPVKNYYMFKFMIRLPAALQSISESKDLIRSNHIEFSSYDKSDCDVLEVLANDGQRFSKHIVYNKDTLSSIDQLATAQAVSDALESLNTLIMARLNPRAPCKASLEEAFSVIAERNKQVKASEMAPPPPPPVPTATPAKGWF